MKRSAIIYLSVALGVSGVLAAEAKDGLPVDSGEINLRADTKQEEEISNLVTGFSEHGPPSAPEVILELGKWSAEKYLEAQKDEYKRQECIAAIANYRTNNIAVPNGACGKTSTEDESNSNRTITIPKEQIERNLEKILNERLNRVDQTYKGLSANLDAGAASQAAVQVQAASNQVDVRTQKALETAQSNQGMTSSFQQPPQRPTQLLRPSTVKTTSPTPVVSGTAPTGTQWQPVGEIVRWTSSTGSVGASSPSQSPLRYPVSENCPGEWRYNKAC